VISICYPKLVFFRVGKEEKRGQFIYGYMTNNLR